MLVIGAWQRRRLQLRRHGSELHAGPGGAARRHRLSIEQRQPARVSLVDLHGRTTSIPTSVGINQGFSPIAPTSMAYSSAHQRLYLGYGTGAIRYIDVTAEPRRSGIRHDGDGREQSCERRQFPAGAGQRRYDDALRHQQQRRHHRIRAGTTTDTRAKPRGTRSPHRIYYTRDGISPNDLHYDVIDQVTGAGHRDRRDALSRRLQLRRRRSASPAMAVTSCWQLATSSSRAAPDLVGFGGRAIAMRAGSPTARWSR